MAAGITLIIVALAMFFGTLRMKPKRSEQQLVDRTDYWARISASLQKH